MKNEFEQDKDYLLKWMEKHANGFRNARTKNDILPHLLGSWDSRYFQRVVSELKHDNHISSTRNRGYWFNPLFSNDREEIQAQLHSAQEMKSRALTILEGAEKTIRACQDKLIGVPYQPSFL